MSMNKTSWIKLYRQELTVRLKSLNDQEFRLLIHYASLAGWDVRHPNFGTFRKTVRDLKDEQLPSWGIGKISRITNSLIEKGFLSRLKNSRICVKYYWLYRSSQPTAEQAYQAIEQNIPISEQGVLKSQQTELDNMRSGLTDMLKIE